MPLGGGASNMGGGRGATTVIAALGFVLKGAGVLSSCSSLLVP